MNSSVIAADGMIFQSDGSLTVIGKTIQTALGTKIIQGSYYFEGRSRRILPHGGSVQKAAVGFVIYKCIPVLGDRIRIKVRFTDHCKDLACGRLQCYYCSLTVSQRVVGSCLQIGI